MHILQIEELSEKLGIREEEIANLKKQLFDQNFCIEAEEKSKRRSTMRVDVLQNEMMSLIKLHKTNAQHLNENYFASIDALDQRMTKNENFIIDMSQKQSSQKLKTRALKESLINQNDVIVDLESLVSKLISLQKALANDTRHSLNHLMF